MDINNLVGGIMKAINRYTDEIVAERVQLQMSQSDEARRAQEKIQRILGAEKIKLRWISQIGNDYVGIAAPLKAA